MAPIARKCSTLPATTTAGTMPAAGAGERAKVKGNAHAETLLIWFDSMAGNTFKI